MEWHLALHMEHWTSYILGETSTLTLKMDVHDKTIDFKLDRIKQVKGFDTSSAVLFSCIEQRGKYSINLYWQVVLG